MFSICILAICCTLAQGAKKIPPQIEYYPPDDLDNVDDVKAGTEGDFKLKCTASGSFPLTFQWKVNGRPVAMAFLGSVLFNLEPRNATYSRTQILHVKQPSPDADGKYQCEVTNAAGGTFTRKLRVKVTYASVFIEGQNTPAGAPQEVTVGRPTRLACPPRKTKFKDFGVYFTWGRKIQTTVEFFQIDNQPNRVLLPNGNLLFLYLKNEDLKEIENEKYKGMLQCNIAASTNDWSKPLKLTKKAVEDSEFAAKFESTDDYPKTTETAVQGKEKKLFCVAVGNPVPEISWVRLEEDKTTVMKTIKHGEDGFEFAQDRRTLKIPVVSKEQHERGYYQCIAKNLIANVVKTAKTHLTKLEVFVAPKWLSKPEKVKEIPVEGDAKLLCEAVGTPPPSYKWYHNAKPFTSDDELKPNVIVDGKVLKFSNIRSADEGVFQCAVENDWGMLVSSTWVKIKVRKPDITKFGPFYLFKETEATLKCDSNAAPAAKHIWKKDDKVITIDKKRYFLGVNNSLVIKKVVDSDEGMYTCDASNQLGKDSATAKATVYGT